MGMSSRSLSLSPFWHIRPPPSPARLSLSFITLQSTATHKKPICHTLTYRHIVLHHFVTVPNSLAVHILEYQTTQQPSSFKSKSILFNKISKSRLLWVLYRAYMSYVLIYKSWKSGATSTVAHFPFLTSCLRSGLFSPPPRPLNLSRKPLGWSRYMIMGYLRAAVFTYNCLAAG